MNGPNPIFIGAVIIGFDGLSEKDVESGKEYVGVGGRDLKGAGYRK